MSRRVSLNAKTAEMVIRQLCNYTEILENTLGSTGDVINKLESDTKMLEGFVRDYGKQVAELKQTLEIRDQQIERFNAIIDEMGVLKDNQPIAEPRGRAATRTYKKGTKAL